MSDVWTYVGTAALRSGTGTQDLTVSGIVAQPKALIIEAQAGTVLGAGINGVKHGIGFADSGGRSTSISYQSEDGVGTMNCDRYVDTQNADLVLISTAGGIESRIQIDSSGSAGPIAGGWRINVTTNGNAGAYIKYRIFGGSDLQAYADGWVHSAADGLAETRSPGFKTRLAYFLSAGLDSFEDTVRPDSTFSMGAAAYDGTSTITQASTSWNMDDSTTNAIQTQIVRNNRCVGYAETTERWGCEVTSVNASTIDVTSRGTVASDTVHALFLGFPDSLGSFVGVEDTPTTAASDWTVNSIGFEPQSVDVISTIVRTENTVFTNFETEAWGSQSIDRDNNQVAIGARSDDGAATSSVNSIIHDRFAYQYNNTVVAFDIETSASPFNASGLTISASDITAMDSQIRKWIFVAIQTATGDGKTAESAGGGSSLTARQQRELERLQLIQRDDQEIIDAIMAVVRND